jgi:hypothetical protein
MLHGAMALEKQTGNNRKKKNFLQNSRGIIKSTKKPPVPATHK